MPTLPTPRRRATLARALCGAALVLTMGAAIAGPDMAGDPVSRFLADKGLIDKGLAAPADSVESSFTRQLRQVRNGASDMVLTAMNFLGVPYKRGGTSADDGFDCSGFTRHIFEMSLGLVLPRRADEQAGAAGLLNVKRDDLKPGDLVFFNTLKRTFSHVGIYVGDGKFIHSPRPGGEVRVEDMRFAYWQKRYTGARRAPQTEPVAAPEARAEPHVETRPLAVLPVAAPALPVEAVHLAH